MARTTKAPQDPMDFAMAFLTAKRQASAEKRAAYLAQGYIECIVPNCTGLVGPAYQQEFQGQKVGFCPRTKDHRALAPAMFAR